MERDPVRVVVVLSNGNDTVLDPQRWGKVPLWAFNGGQKIFKDLLDGELNVY